MGAGSLHGVADYAGTLELEDRHSKLNWLVVLGTWEVEKLEDLLEIFLVLKDSYD